MIQRAPDLAIRIAIVLTTFAAAWLAILWFPELAIGDYASEFPQLFALGGVFVTLTFTAMIEDRLRARREMADRSH